MNPIIYLIGYRCTGKSTTGKLLADLLDCPFFDTDRLIEEKYMTTLEEMVKEKGWDYFRSKERKILSATGHLSRCVIATGGGIVLDPENRTFIRTRGICAWLYAETAILVDRILADVQNLQSRPRFSNGSLFLETQKMLDLRTPLYRELGQININTGCHSPRQAASIIKRRLSHVRQ
ncbi:MAG: shikimate kinase [Proteobacteria bacterium]|nr:shikimate kinase [Pseudomonadota bacterium]